MVNWTVSLLGDGFWTKFKDFITGIFALIPQFVYFFYTCVASVIDVLQYLIRKLAGLDTYYVNGVEAEGDILSQLVNGVLGVNGKYSALNTVFWSMIIFGLIILILGIIISIIKAHYNYDEQKARPSFIIGKALKNVTLMAIVPIVSILGIYLANIFLKALDSITSSSSVGTTAEVFASAEGNYQTVFEARDDEWGNPTYVSYDFFGSDAPTGTVTISGVLFKATANSCNRVRYGGYTANAGGSTLAPDDGKWSNCGIFSSNLSSPAEQKEAIAYMIDYAFANNLRLSEKQTVSILKEESITLVSSFKYLQSAVWYAGTIEFKSFSKYNVGLVWYYYNLWQFNFVIAFIGALIAVVLVSNIVFGLMVRLLECTALMICLGPIIGMSPLEDGAAFKEWRKTFISDVLTAYGAIGGLNLSFMLLPYIQKLMFFSSPLLNSIAEMMLIIVLLLAIKQVVSLIAGFVGGGDAAAIGGGLKGDVSGAAKNGASGAAAAASLAVKLMKLFPATKAAAAAIEGAKNKIAEAVKKSKKSKKSKNSKKKNKTKASKGPSKFRQKIENIKTRIYGEGEDISEEEHNKLVDEEKNKLEKEKNENNEKIEDNNKENDDNDTKIKENEAAAANKEAEADRLEQEAEIAEQEKKFKVLYDGFIRSGKALDINDYLDKKGVDKLKDKKLVNKINSQKERIKNGHIKLSKDKRGLFITDSVYADVVDKIKKDRNWEKEGQEKIQAASDLRKEAAYLRGENTTLKNRNSAIRSENYTLSSRNAEIDDRLAEMNTEGFTLEGKRVIRKLLPQGFSEMIAQFNGETFKAVNSSLGLDDMFKKLDKETSIVDSGRTIFRDLALSLGIQLNSARAFQTKKETADRKKAQKQERQVVDDGVKEDRDMLGAVNDLAEALKKLKVIN